LALAVGGLNSIVVGLGLSSPVIAEPEVRRGVPEVARAVNRPATVAQLRLERTPSSQEAWSHFAATDLVTRDRQASGRPSTEVSAQPRQRFQGEGTGRDPLAPFARWDLREALQEMANAQYGNWRRQCPCLMGQSETGSG
jgi:hypothetical protein